MDQNYAEVKADISSAEEADPSSDDYSGDYYQLPRISTSKPALLFRAVHHCRSVMDGINELENSPMKFMTQKNQAKLTDSFFMTNEV